MQTSITNHKKFHRHYIFIMQCVKLHVSVSKGNRQAMIEEFIQTIKYSIKPYLLHVWSHIFIFLITIYSWINNVFVTSFIAYIGFWWGNLRERDHLGDPGIDEKVILKWIIRQWDVGVWTGSIWLRIGTGGGHLWMW
jgi:hypothetical protein